MDGLTIDLVLAGHRSSTVPLCEFSIVVVDPEVEFFVVVVVAVAKAALSPSSSSSCGAAPLAVPPVHDFVVVVVRVVLVLLGQVVVVVHGVGRAVTHFQGESRLKQNLDL